MHQPIHDRICENLLYLNRASGGVDVHGLVSAIDKLELVNFVSLVLSYHTWRPGDQRAPEFVAMLISWDTT